VMHPVSHPGFHAVFVISLHKFKARFCARFLVDFQAQDPSFYVQLVSYHLEFNWLPKTVHLRTLPGLHYKLHGFGTLVRSRGK